MFSVAYMSAWRIAQGLGYTYTYNLCITRYNFTYNKHLLKLFTLEDIDECAMENGGCDHSCHNYDGGRYCSCNVGYRLATDTTCEGMSMFCK